MDSLNLEKVVSLDSVTNVEDTYRPLEVIERGGVNKTIYRSQCDSYGNNSLNFNNICPPSLTTVVQRVLRLHYHVYVTCVYNSTAAAGNYPLFPAVKVDGTYFGAHNPSCVLRAFPMASACSGMELKINGISTSVSPNDTASIYPHLLTEKEQQLYCADFPVQKDDMALYYLDAVDNRSPFTPYELNTNVPSRACFLASVNSVAGGGNINTDTYNFEVYETLIISPMTYGDGQDGPGLVNINNLTLQLKIADVNRMISVMPSAFTATAGNTPTITVTLNPPGAAIGNTSRPEMLLCYITQDPQVAARQPEEVVYNYELITPYPNTVGAWANTTADTQVTSQALRLSTIPDKIFIYAKPSLTWLSTSAANQQTTPDFFLRIKQLQLNWGNKISIFGQHSESDLWKMSVRNGLQDSFRDWQYNSGSLLIINPAIDGLLEPEEAPGQNTYTTMMSTLTLSASPMAYSTQAGPINFDLYVVVSQNGKCAISKTQCLFTTAGPNGAEVLAAVADVGAKVDLGGHDSQSKALSANGGSVWGGLGKLLHKGLSLASKVKPEHLEHAHKGLNFVKDQLKNLGVGGAVTAGKLAKHKRTY